MNIRSENVDYESYYVWSKIDWGYILDVVITALNSLNLFFAHISLLASLYYTYIYAPNLPDDGTNNTPSNNSPSSSGGGAAFDWTWLYSWVSWFDWLWSWGF